MLNSSAAAGGSGVGDNMSASSTTHGGLGGEGAGEDGSAWSPSNPVTVEAYSVVLSAAALVLSTLLGGGGSLWVLLALFQSRRVRKYSYTLVLVLFFLGCGLGLVWAPMELAHLLLYHHTLRGPTTDFGVATFALYVFLLAGLAFLVAAFCAENVLRLGGRFGQGMKRAWPLVVCVAMFLVSLLLAVAFLGASLDRTLQEGSYLVLHPGASDARLSILTLLVVLVVAGAAGVVAAEVAIAYRNKRSGSGGGGGGSGSTSTERVKASESFLSRSNNDGSGGINSPLQHQPYLVKAAPDIVATGSGEDVDKLSVSGSSSKLPDIIGCDVTPATPIKGGNRPAKLSELPVAASRGPTMLGVNMNQILGRRRHTICQIGDSSTPPDPISKAKQYTYVRKFSVDISALQAQLENPKLFKDKAPFQSDQDLRQRNQSNQQKVRMPESREPLLPLLGLGAKLDGGGGGGAGGGVKGGEGGDGSEAGGGGVAGGVKMSLPSRPPVITVSEDMKEDAEGEINEEEEAEEEDVKTTAEEKNLNSTTARTVYTPILDKAELTSIPRLPVTQPVDEEDEEEEEEDEDRQANARGGVRDNLLRRGNNNNDVHDDEEDELGDGVEEDTASCKSANSHDPHHHHHHLHRNDSGGRLTESEQDFVKMSLLMALTFFLCTFPLLLFELMRSSLSVHAYVNLSTCARALSALQVIIYPHVVICMDAVVHKAVGGFKVKVARLCACALRDADCLEMQPDQGSISTS